MSAELLPRRDGRQDTGGEDTPAGPYPALDALNAAQKDALDRFRKEGFADREELIIWLHKLQFYALGRIPWWWYYEFCTSTVALEVVVTDANANYRDEISPAAARSERRRLASKYLRPACRRAYRELSTAATEYLDEDIDFEKSGAFALRPALNTYYTRQHDALTSFLDGFEDVDALQRWCHRLDRVTHGSISAVEKQLEMQFDVQVVENKTARRALTSPDEPRYQNERERLAARWLLPACNLSVRKISARAGESTETEPETMPAPPG